MVRRRDFGATASRVTGSNPQRVAHPIRVRQPLRQLVETPPAPHCGVLAFAQVRPATCGGGVVHAQPKCIAMLRRAAGPRESNAREWCDGIRLVIAPLMAVTQRDSGAHVAAGRVSRSCVRCGPCEPEPRDARSVASLPARCDLSTWDRTRNHVDEALRARPSRAIHRRRAFAPLQSAKGYACVAACSGVAQSRLLPNTLRVVACGPCEPHADCAGLASWAAVTDASVCAADALRSVTRALGARDGAPGAAGCGALGGVRIGG